MSNLDSSQTGSDKGEQQFNFEFNFRSSVDMANPNDTQRVFKRANDFNTSVISSDGQLIFGNPFESATGSHGCHLQQDCAQGAQDSPKYGARDFSTLPTDTTTQPGDSSSQSPPLNFEQFFIERMRDIELDLKAFEDEILNAFGPSNGDTPTPPVPNDTPTPPAPNDTPTPPSPTDAIGPNSLHMGDMGDFGMATVDAQGKGFAQKYGAFEASMKLPPGGWPGFWLMSTNHAFQGGPASEIDIMEAGTAQNPNAYYTTLHSDSANSSLDKANPNNFATTFADGTPLPTDLTTAYHNYGVIWPPDGNTLTYTLDGKAVTTVPKFSTTDSSPMMLILGQGSGDILGLNPGTPGTLDVKSVNVYQYTDQLNNSNDPGGTQYADSNLTKQIDGKTLVSTFHQDFTAPNMQIKNIVSNDGAANNTPFTDHLWYEQQTPNESALSFQPQ
jgi:beta-glucanase (GH16 family)